MIINVYLGYDKLLLDVCFAKFFIFRIPLIFLLIFAQFTIIAFVKLVLVQPLCSLALLLVLNMLQLLVQAPNPLLLFS